MKDIVQELWIACSAGPGDLPVGLRIEDGLHDPIVHTYFRPGRLRVKLPMIPAGEIGIFAVRTDKAWCPGDGKDPRMLGVHLSTKA